MSDQTGRDFLGAGPAFPFVLDESGALRSHSLDEHVRQSMLLILATVPGERVMRPDFGAGLRELVFAPLNPATAAMLRHEVREAMVRFEPRVDVLGVDVRMEAEGPGSLVVEMSCRVRATDTMFNLVYPFYLDRGQS
ncbi:baseplate protein [Actinoplanes italicus]|uniref:IraD/Gp25-like domain-containing protein n=1 Tax=Actinoplanes italicus TaxID=113567 RepID=A0A2T0K347_9ACTN|nr:GPW/gp25 family protein [Actinoplanes italicus]PRX17283.1 hypothetical protein CLV67_11659 [Actinoplanes italicus]GIE35159.1 baseplate protein [Actinoplanes italicus]